MVQAGAQFLYAHLKWPLMPSARCKSFDLSCCFLRRSVAMFGLTLTAMFCCLLLARLWWLTMLGDLPDFFLPLLRKCQSESQEIRMSDHGIQHVDATTISKSQLSSDLIFSTTNTLQFCTTVSSQLPSVEFTRSMCLPIFCLPDLELL